jgi:hypothetical protein
MPQWVSGPGGDALRQAANSSLASANCESLKTQSSGSKGVPGMAGDKCSLRSSQSIPAASNRLRTSPISALSGEEYSRFIILQSCCRRTIQLTDGGRSVTSELPDGVAGPPCGGVPDSAGSPFFGSLAVSSKRLSRANHGHGAGTKKPTTSSAHTPVATTMQRWVIFIAHTSCLTLLLQNTIRYPVTELYHDRALNSSTGRTQSSLAGSSRQERKH